MVNERDLIDEARTVLEGRHAFQYIPFRQRAAYKRLLETIETTTPGNVIMIGGLPGSGITTCLYRLAVEKPGKVMMLRCDFYIERFSLIDRVCDMIFAGAASNSCRGTPAWLTQYLKVAGIGTIMIDDLDLYVSSPTDIQKVVGALDDLAKSAKVTVIAVIRDTKLIHRFVKRRTSEGNSVWIEGVISEAESTDMAKEFFTFNNRRLSIALDWTVLDDRAIRGTEHHIDCIMRLAEVRYVEALVRYCIPSLTLFNNEPEECLYELARVLNTGVRTAMSALLTVFGRQGCLSRRSLGGTC